MWFVLPDNSRFKHHVGRPLTRPQCAVTLSLMKTAAALRLHSAYTENIRTQPDGIFLTAAGAHDMTSFQTKTSRFPQTLLHKLLRRISQRPDRKVSLLERSVGGWGGGLGFICCFTTDHVNHDIMVTLSPSLTFLQSENI